MLFAGEVKGVKEAAEDVDWSLKYNVDKNKDGSFQTEDLTKGTTAVTGYVISDGKLVDKKTDAPLTIEEWLKTLGFDVVLEGVTESDLADMATDKNMLTKVEGKVTRLKERHDALTKANGELGKLQTLIEKLKADPNTVITDPAEKALLGEILDGTGKLKTDVNIDTVLDNVKKQLELNMALEKHEKERTDNLDKRIQQAKDLHKAGGDKALEKSNGLLGGAQGDFMKAMMASGPRATSVSFGVGPAVMANGMGYMSTPGVSASMSSYTGGSNFASSPVLAMMQNDMVLESFADALKNQSEGQKMMALFYYLAQAAMTGDLGAMYRFLMFVTWIVSRDKAKETVHLSKQMMKYQQQSREITQKMVSKDGQDGSLYKDQADLKEINMSQTLITNVMQEFFSFIESMMNMVDETRRTHARVMRQMTSPK